VTFPVVWLMPDVPRAHNDSRWRLTWAQSQIEDILTELGGEHTVGFDDVDGGAAVVIPGEYYVDAVDWIGNDIIVEAVSDPEVKGITCHVTYFDRSLIDRFKNGG